MLQLCSRYFTSSLLIIPLSQEVFSQPLSREPLEKWRGTLSNPLRKAWTWRYLLWLGKERAAAMGYDLESLLADLGSIRPGFRNVMQDARRLTMGRLAVSFNERLFRKTLGGP
ncbi:MAG: hypothetical protein ACREYE_05695 [Gammaproteobacteria bacterium]